MTRLLYTTWDGFEIYGDEKGFSIHHPNAAHLGMSEDVEGSDCIVPWTEPNEPEEIRMELAHCRELIVMGDCAMKASCPNPNHWHTA